MVTRYAQQGVAADLSLRVYTSRLLGQDPLLVLHGGGNTSVKTTATDLAGEEVEVLCVKGSGWDLGDIEPAGLPAVRLKPLLKLREREKLSDEDMVRYQRANLLDPSAPNPSVETLLHAFLPQKYVDHTHSTAVLSIADQPDAEALCAEIYGKRLGIVPYIMPGFVLAKKAAEVYEADPAVEGLVLLKHGIFTFGADARESYERMIAAVTRAEERIAKGRKRAFAAAALPTQIAPVHAVAPILRGACSLPDAKAAGAWRRLVLEFRASPAILAYVNGSEVTRYAQQGVVTPDHTIRTKNIPLILPAPDAGDLDDFRTAARDAGRSFIAAYHAYFRRNNAGRDPQKRALDPLPRVALVPGLGLFGMGRSKKDASVAADIAENTVLTITDAEAIGKLKEIYTKRRQWRQLIDLLAKEAAVLPEADQRVKQLAEEFNKTGDSATLEKFYAALDDQDIAAVFCVFGQDFLGLFTCGSHDGFVVVYAENVEDDLSGARIGRFNEGFRAA